MSARTDAIFSVLSERFPGRRVRELSGERWTLGGSEPVVEFLDHTTQDIGGPMSGTAVSAYADGRVFYLSDADLPAPDRLPMSQTVRLFQVINGI